MRSTISRVASEISPERLATRFVISRAAAHGSLFRRERAIPTPTAAPIATPIQIARLRSPFALISICILPPLLQCSGLHLTRNQRGREMGAHVHITLPLFVNALTLH